MPLDLATELAQGGLPPHTATALASQLQPLVSGAGIQPNITNFQRLNYKNFRKALADLRVGARGNLPIMCIGDSTTQGSNGNTATNAIQNSWVRRLADLLTSNGIQAGWQNCFGDHQTVNSQGSTLQLNDPRVAAFPAGWVLGGGLTPGPGGQFFYNNSTLNPLTFTPTVQTDTCEVYYLDVGGYDPFLVKSGAAGATVPTTGGTATIAGALNVKKLVSTYTLGANVWTVQRAGTGTVCIPVGISCYNSALPEISLWNMGCGSQKVSYFTATANFWDTQRQLTDATSAIAAAPLAIINIGINDWVNATSPAAYAASLTQLIAALQANNTDVLLIVPVPSVSTSAPLAAQAALVAQIYAVATAQNVGVLDLTARWGSFAQSSALYGDSAVHPSYSGYSDIAQALLSFFRSI